MDPKEFDIDGLGICVVADQIENCAPIGVILEQFGALVHYVRPSHGASFSPMQARPVLSIWDFADGEEEELLAVRKFRDRYSFQEVGLLPMIALTSSSEARHLRKLYEEGFQAVLPKPIEQRYLLEVISSLAFFHRQWAAEVALSGGMSYSCQVD